MELYPATLFGKTWIMDNKNGIFTRQANGPVILDNANENQAVPFATGKKLVICPESDEQRISFESASSDLQLLDGRIRHTNGWFVVRSLIPDGATTEAIKWTVKVNSVPDWKSKPVVHLSQVGYHPKQPKIAIVELDATDKQGNKASLIHITGDGEKKQVKTL